MCVGSVEKEEGSSLSEMVVDARASVMYVFVETVMVGGMNLDLNFDDGRLSSSLV